MYDSKPFPEENFNEFFYIYKCNEMYITITKSKVDFHQTDSHAHDGYEFIIPLTEMPYAGVENENIYAKRHTILPINPWQKHGPTAPMESVRFIDILVDKDYFVNTAASVYGIKKPVLSNRALVINSELQHNIKAFIREGELSHPGKELILQSLACQFVVRILREACEGFQLNLKEPASHNHKNVHKVIQYLQENYSSECTLEQLSEISGMSRYHFIRSFNKVTGKTPFEYLIDIRLEKAMDLLRNGDLSITKIATMCGFNNSSYFSVLFKKKMGDAPSTYRGLLSF